MLSPEINLMGNTNRHLRQHMQDQKSQERKLYSK